MTEHASRPSYSLRTRLLLWLLVPLVVIGLLALFDSYRSARETADEIADRVLAGSALAIAERIFVNDDGLLEVDMPYVALEMLTSSEEDRVFYRIEGGGSEFITGYRQLAVPDAFDRSERNLRFADARFRDVPIRMAVLNDAAASDTVSLAYRVIIAETTNARAKMARDILLRSALRQGLLIFTAALVVWFAVTRSLRPLYRLQEAVGRRSPNDLRPIEHRVPGEVSGLVATINDLVKRFGSSISALRNFTSNASHQLRTPLTVMRTQLELASRAKTEADREKALKETDNAIGEAERVLSQLLVLARVDSTARDDLARHRCDIATISRDICEDLISGNLPADIDLGYEGPERLEIAGDEVLTREMMRNVIDNAIVHGGRPIEITIRVRRENGGVTIEVEDSGTGVDPKQLKNVLSRFQRGSGGSEGSGLGLAVAKEIAELFGGQLELAAPLQGGFLVRMRFRTS
ncbi:sensor histidine kinase [Nitratireductor sp. XY-223]|uniref:sensor histidine kinase n=1 Tax=Nitratireductor sp. XY-223 TaxID=2561926 RepID=UPI0010AB1876|nr:sensor histidine kinase [Nitratireductor sp. XY-223]